MQSSCYLLFQRDGGVAVQRKRRTGTCAGAGPGVLEGTGSRDWPSQGMPRLVQFEQGEARSHLSFLERQKLQLVWGCLRRRRWSCWSWSESGPGPDPGAEADARRFIVTDLTRDLRLLTPDSGRQGELVSGAVQRLGSRLHT